MTAIFSMNPDFINNNNVRLFMSRSDKKLDSFSFRKAKQLIGAEPLSTLKNYTGRLVARTTLEASTPLWWNFRSLRGLEGPQPFESISLVILR